MFVKVKNGIATQYTIGQLRRDNPNVVFPRTISEKTLRNFSVFKAVKEKVSFNEETQYVVDGPVVLEGGKYVIKQVIKPYSAEQLEERRQEKVQLVLATRDAELSYSDWMVIREQETGIAMPSEWKDYRQALRDITEVEGFPYVEFPVKPTV